jgi:hypothetical protein
VKIKVSVFLLFLMVLTSFGMAQDNLPSYDRQKLRFGFLIGFNNSNLKVFEKPQFYLSDTLLSATPIGGPGFNIGIVTNVLLWKYVDLRFTPNLSFIDRQIQYTFADATKNSTRSIESTNVEFPLGFKIRSIRHRNVGFYVIGGAKFSYDVISQKKIQKGEDPFDESTRKVKLQNYDIAYEWGFGWDLYYQYFKFSPEFKFAYGTRDILKKEGHIYSRPLDQLFSRVVCLTLYFE